MEFENTESEDTVVIRERLVGAARQLLNIQGEDITTVEEVARRAGIEVQLFFSHVFSLEGLLEVV